MNLDSLSVLFWPALALLGGSLVLAPLGVEVLRRGIVFVDLAIAQGAALVALAVQIRWHEAAIPVILGAALLGAMATAWLVRFLVNRFQERREAAIGLVYLLGACAGLILSSFDAHGHAHFTQLLSADVLWVDRGQALLLIGLAAIVLVLRSRGGWIERDIRFYPLIGLGVGLTVLTLGVYLVFALLVAPALWAGVASSTRHTSALLAYAVLVSWLGLAVSYALDWPSGATVATTLALLSLMRPVNRAA